MKFQHAAWLLALIGLAGCFDFVEPELSDESNNAVFQLNVVETEAGQFSLNGLLLVGIDRDGFRRAVNNDTVYIMGRAIGPTSISDNESRIYQVFETQPSDDRLGPFTVTAPVVRDVALMPAVHWPGITKIGGDTIILARGQALTLTVAVDSTTPRPARPFQSWQVELGGATNRFFVGGSGMPPDRIQIPSNFIPQPPDSVVNVVLMAIQSGQMRANEYRALYNYTMQMNWMVRIR